MSLDKGIEHGKEHRNPHKNHRTDDWNYRNYVGCVGYLSDRTHKNKVKEDAADYQLEDEFKPRNKTANGKHKHKLSYKEWLEREKKWMTSLRNYPVILWWENKKDGRPKNKND